MPTAGKPNTTKPSELPDTFNGLFFGASGVGKTHLMGTVGKGKKVLVADVEGGSVTYSSTPYQSDENATERDNIDIIPFPFTGPDEVKTAAELVHLIEGTLDWLIRTNNEDGYELFVVDSLTEFQARFLNLHGASDPRQSYNAMADALHTIVLKARQAPVHVIFLSRPVVKEDPETNAEVIRADVAPSAWKQISGLLDAVGYYKARTQGATTKRVLDFTHSNRFFAKNRYGLTELTNPTLKEVFAIMRQADAEAAKTEEKKATPKRGRPRKLTPAQKAA